MAPVTTIEITYPAATVRQNIEHNAYEATAAGTVTAVSILPDAAVTGANSPRSRKFQLVNLGSTGEGTTVMAELRLAERTNLRRGVKAALTLAREAREREFRAGDVLVFKSLADTEAEGLADTGGGTLQVAFEKAATEAAAKTEFVRTGSEEKEYGWSGKRARLRHPDSSYSTQSGPSSPSGTRGPE